MAPALKRARIRGRFVWERTYLCKQLMKWWLSLAIFDLQCSSVPRVFECTPTPTIIFSKVIVEILIVILNLVIVICNNLILLVTKPWYLVFGIWYLRYWVRWMKTPPHSNTEEKNKLHSFFLFQVETIDSRYCKYTLMHYSNTCNYKKTKKNVFKQNT